LDRRRRRAALLGLGLLAAAAATALAQAPATALKAMNWLAPGADPVRLLARAPTECLRRPSDPQAALAVEVGRAAFRTPVLLGGQAARAGLSCESCHRSGRGNPDFLFPGVSGAPGTADVTSSLFSSHRGDFLDDPRPIPDLSGDKARLKVDQTPARAALEPFIEGLVVEEFDGPRPPAAVLAGLAAYVRSLEPQACPEAATQPVTAALLMADARRALAAARALADKGDRAGAALMVAGARARLGLIDERYAGPALRPERNRLRAADAGLTGIAEALREGRPDAAERLDAWTRAAPALEAALRRREAVSLLDPARLRAVSRRALAPARSIGILPGSAKGPPLAAAG
jgi:hypothetical protein